MIPDHRIRRALASLSEEADPTDECPPAEEFWSAIRGELTPERGRKLAVHAAACVACAETFRFTRDLHSEAYPAPVNFPA